MDHYWLFFFCFVVSQTLFFQLTPRLKEFTLSLSLPLFLSFVFFRAASIENQPCGNAARFFPFALYIYIQRENAQQKLTFASYIYIKREKKRTTIAKLITKNSLKKNFSLSRHFIAWIAKKNNRKSFSPCRMTNSTAAEIRDGGGGGEKWKASARASNSSGGGGG